MGNTYALNYTMLQHDIFRAICKTAGSKINQRTLAAKLDVTPAAVSRALPVLQDDGLIVVNDYGRMNLKEIELNRENRRAVQLKRVENLKELYLSGLADFIAEKYAGCTIILFGSYARGEDTIRSDIDIAVIGAKEKKIDVIPYQQMLEREIRFTCLNSLAGISKEFKENLFNGIVLAGGITL